MDDDFATCDDCGVIYRLSEGHECPYDEGYIIWPDDPASQR